MVRECSEGMLCWTLGALDDLHAGQGEGGLIGGGELTDWVDGSRMFFPHNLDISAGVFRKTCAGESFNCSGKLSLAGFNSCSSRIFRPQDFFFREAVGALLLCFFCSFTGLFGGHVHCFLPQL